MTDKEFGVSAADQRQEQNGVGRIVQLRRRGRKQDDRQSCGTLQYIHRVVVHSFGDEAAAEKKQVHAVGFRATSHIEEGIGGRDMIGVDQTRQQFAVLPSGAIYAVHNVHHGVKNNFNPVSAFSRLAPDFGFSAHWASDNKTYATAMSSKNFVAKTCWKGRPRRWPSTCTRSRSMSCPVMRMSLNGSSVP